MSNFAQQRSARSKLMDRLSRHYDRKEYVDVVKNGRKLAQHGQMPDAALTLMAASYVRLGDAAQAEKCFRSAMEMAPQKAVNFTHLADLLRKQARYGEAQAVCSEGLARHPGEAELQFVAGTVLRDSKQYVEALQAFSRVLELAPNHSSAIHEMGVVLTTVGQYDRATEAFCTVLMLEPEHASALRNLGQCLSLAGRKKESIDIFRLALSKSPDNHFLRLRKAYQQMHICDWSEFGEVDGLLDKAEALCDAGTPFVMLAFADDPAVQLRHCQAYLARLGGAAAPRPAMPEPATNGKIRVGYLSADFHNHATMYLLAGLFREHDRDRFELHAFSYGPDCPDHAMRQLAIAATDRFTDLRSHSDAEAADLIRAAELDVLVDLKGYTEGSRPGILLHRPAALQVAYLGFPGSMGGDFIDYLVVDDALIPAAERQHYVERLITLPGCYQPNDNLRPIAGSVATREELGLPQDGFVFCSFNQTYKITPVEFDIWMRLLANVEGSVLWQLATDADTQANLLAEAEQRGIDPDRLIFAEKLPQAEHLARLAQGDLFLDTFRVNAHTTMSDALWAGLPAVTLAGRQFAARVGASVLAGAGLPDLVTHSADEYESLCLNLARNPDRLTAIRGRLAENRHSCSLFDTASYARTFEAGLLAAVERARSGEAPADIRMR